MSGSKGGGQRLGFAENFLISGAAAAISKTSAAPIERVKLLLQNQVRGAWWWWWSWWSWWWWW